MPNHFTYDYAIVRVVPKVEREEFVNVGVVLFCATQRYLKAEIELYEERLLALDPTLDLPLIGEYLAALPRICAGGAGAGPIGQLPLRERFDWIVAPRSTIIQTSRVHTGLCINFTTAIERLLNTTVRPVSRLQNGAAATAKSSPVT